MVQPNQFDTETKLFCTVEQAEQLIEKLEAAVAMTKKCDSMEYVRQDCEQLSNNGPWRLIIAVKANEN